MPLDRLMKAFASDEPANAGGNTARLEERLDLLLKAFTETVARQEKSLSETREAFASLERQVTGSNTLAKTKSLVIDDADSPRVLPPDGQIEMEMASASEQPTPGPLQASPASAPAQPLSYLAAARRAANATMAPKQDAARSRSKEARSEPRSNRGRLLLYACVPVVILAAGGILLSRHTVPAKPVQQRAIRIAKIPAAPVIQQAALPPASAVAPAPALAPAPGAESKPAQVETVVVEAVSTGELQKRAGAGEAQSERDLGLRYLDGEGVAANETEGARWLLNAAYKGDPSAEYWVGSLYAGGSGLPADVHQAAHWYEAAAKQGFIQSQLALGSLYQQGKGVPRNLAEAYKWYAIAARHGDKTAGTRLAILAKQMKPADLAAAQRSAARFKPAPQGNRVNSASNSG